MHLAPVVDFFVTVLEGQNDTHLDFVVPIFKLCKEHRLMRTWVERNSDTIICILDVDWSSQNAGVIAGKDTEEIRKLNYKSLRVVGVMSPHRE